MNKHHDCIKDPLDDLPKLLRIKSNMIYSGEKIAFGSECELMDVAANEIERLRGLKEKHFKSAVYAQDKAIALTAERDRYRDALKEIVDHGESDCYIIAIHALELSDD